MIAFLGKALNIRREEGRRLVLLSAVVFVFILGITWAQIVIPAAFVAQVGFELLPYVFIGEAIAIIIGTMIYSAFVDNYSDGRVMIGLVVIGAVGVVIGRVLLDLDLIRPGFIYLYMLFRVLNEMISTHLGTYINGFFDTQAAKRILPVIFSVLRVAMIVAGVTVPFLNQFFRARDILILWGMTLLGIAVLVWLSPRLLREIKPLVVSTPAQRASYIDNVRDGFKFVLQAPFLRAMMMAAFLSLIVATVLNYQTANVFQETLVTTANIANFTGALTAIGSIITLPIQLFLYGWIVSRIGVGNTSLIYPLTTLAVSGLLIAMPSNLSAAGLVFLNLNTLNVAFRVITDNLLYNAVPNQVKGRARAVIGGVVIPLGTLVAGVLLLLPQVVDAYWFLPVILGFPAISYLLAALIVRSLYGKALINLLERENYSLILRSAGNFNFNDGATISYLKNKLGDRSDPNAVIITASLLVEGMGKDALPHLDSLLRDPDPEMRAAAVDMLVDHQLRGEPVRRIYVDALKDRDWRVRKFALLGLECLAMPNDPDYLAAAARLLDDEDAQIRAHVIPALLHSQPHQAAALAALNSFIKSDDPQLRALGAEVLGRTTNPEVVTMLLECLNDPVDTVHLSAVVALETLVSRANSPAMPADRVAAMLRPLLNDHILRTRLACVRVAGRLPPEQGIPLLVTALLDRSRTVREASLDALATCGSNAVKGLEALLESGDARTRNAALLALARIDRDEYEHALYEAMSDNVAEIYASHNRVSTLDDLAKHPSVHILQATIDEHAHDLLDEIFDLLGARYAGDEVDVVRESLSRDDPRVRASAIEALETMMPPQLAALIVPLCDPSATRAHFLQIGRHKFDYEPLEVGGLLRDLARDDDNAWFRAITLFALGEMLPPAAAAANGRRAPKNLLGMFADEEPVKTAPETPLDAPLPRATVEALLAERAEDPVDDVRVAVRAARRMMSGQTMVEAQREGNMLSVVEKVIFLKGIPFFQGMTVNQLKVLANVCDEELFPENAIIFDEGSPGGKLYVIVSGKVGIERVNKATRKSARLNTLEARSYFGESTLFDNSPTTTTALALTDTLTLRLRYEPLVALMQEYPELSLELIKVLSQRLRETNEQVAALSRSMSRDLHQVYDKL